MVFRKSERRTFRTRSTKYSSSQGGAMARCPLKMTRSKQESTATIRLVNLATKRDSVFMAFSSGEGLVQTPFWREDAVLVQPIWLRLCRIGDMEGAKQSPNGDRSDSEARRSPGPEGATPKLLSRI